MGLSERLYPRENRNIVSNSIEIQTVLKALLEMCKKLCGNFSVIRQVCTKRVLPAGPTSKVLLVSV